MNKQKKGFTLIELLVVIAIIAVLSVVVILTLNPAELLKQARDSNRISDMNTLRSAVSLFLADGNSFTPTATTCYVSTSTAPAKCYMNLTYYTTTSTGSGTKTAVDGTGWVPLNFNAISSGSPFGILPTDPINNSAYFYGFSATGTTMNNFKFVTRTESIKYSNNGSGDIESTDGGGSSSLFEVGTMLTL